MTVSFVAKPYVRASEWWGGVWKPSPGKVLALRSVTVLIRIVNLIILRVLTHTLTLRRSVQIPFACSVLMCLAGLGALLQLLLLFPLSPPEAVGHLASLELLLKPCSGLLAASFSLFKSSSLTMCTPKATVCHCLPFWGENQFLGLGYCFLSCLRGACPALATAVSGRFCGEAPLVSTSGGRTPCLQPVTRSTSALQKRTKSVGNSPVLEQKVCSLLKWKFGPRIPLLPREKGSHGSGLQRRGLWANMAGMERGDRPGSEQRQVTGRD